VSVGPAMTTVTLQRLSPATARVTLTRSECRNAINPQMAQDFGRVAAELQAEGVQTAILDAEGPAFCAGADLKELPEAGHAMYDLLETLLTVPIHWTAVVGGAVRGGGLSVLAACPRVIATPAATFGLPELARGFFPVSVVEGLVPMMGARTAFDLAFSGRAVGPEQAIALGLVSAVVDETALESCLRAELAGLVELAAAGDGLSVGVRLWQDSVRGLLDPRASLDAE
jgi:enoyl-CoA hydratase/carnithine racemase